MTMANEEQFFNKLGEIPVVNDGWNMAVSYYARVKDFNSLTKFALDATESGVKKAAEISAPVINHFQPQIGSVNSYACNTLDAIETKYPLVKQSSKEIRDACLDGYVQPVVDRVKPVVTYVQDVVDNSRKRVERIKTSSTNLVVGARDLGVSTVTHAVNVTLDTPPGRLVTRTVDSVLTRAEELVDKYIPEAQQEGEALEDGAGSTDDDKNVEKMEEMDPSPQRVAVHFRTVSTKVRERMFKRAMRDFRSAKVRTMDVIGKLHNTVDLIDYAKKNLEAARGKVEELWTQVTETSDENREISGNLWVGSVEDRIILIGCTLTRQLKSGISALEKASDEAGQFVRHPITKSKEFTDFIYQFSTDFRNTSVDKARASLHAIQAKLKSVIDSVDSPDWLAVDIEMEGISLEEDASNSTGTSDEDAESPTDGNHI